MNKDKIDEFKKLRIPKIGDVVVHDSQICDIGFVYKTEPDDRHPNWLVVFIAWRADKFNIEFHTEEIFYLDSICWDYPEMRIVQG